MTAVQMRRAPATARAAAERIPPSLLEWLEGGNLTLVHPDRGPITAECWGQLSPVMRANAQDDFEKVVRANSKAAVLFLRP